MQSRQMEFFSEQRMAIANQNVQVDNAQGKAVAGRATFLKDEGKLVLEEQPKLNNPFGEVTGRLITAYLNENRVVAEGNVQASFFPTPQASGKQSAPTSPSRGGTGIPMSNGVSLGGATPGPSPGPTPLPTPSASNGGFHF
jgi:hypothetical protein